MLALTFLLTSSVTAARADSLTLAWDPNPESEVVGYYVFIGTAPGEYSTVVDVGSATSYTFSKLPDTTYYLTVAAYAPGPVVGDRAPEIVGGVTQPGGVEITEAGGSLALANPGDRTSPRGTALTLVLAASGPDRDSIVFSAFGLPDGLDMNPVTGVISGTPSTAGVFNVAVTASDPSANVVTQSFSWSVVSIDVFAPTIAITSPTADPSGFVARDLFVIITGTATDDVGVTEVTWTNSLGGGGTAAGTASWSVIIPLRNGLNLLTLSAHDASGKSADKTIAISF